MKRKKDYGFSLSQQVAFDLAERGENVFITGSAGNGKSYLTKALTTKKTLVCAPTGIAALNVGGSTCHRAFGLPFGFPEKEDWFKVSAKISKVLNRVDRVIISEVGMLRADMLDLIDCKLRIARKNDTPFGGVQAIVEGDFFQLEPIVGYKERGMFYQQYESPFCFSSKSWSFTTCELTHPQRHANIDHYRMLNKVRVGESEGLQELLDVSEDYKLSPDTLHLCCYNKDADNVNRHWYNQNSSKECVYHADVMGKISEKDVLVDQTLKVKVGCKVLICANSELGDYVNGSTGVVVNLIGGIRVKLDDGAIVDVTTHTWETVDYKGVGDGIKKEVVGSFTQYPIRLGWAISIHKSQGITLDDAAIHLGKGAFSHGMLYVGVSRVRDLGKLQFLRKSLVSTDDLIVRGEVKDFYGIGLQRVMT